MDKLLKINHFIVMLIVYTCVALFFVHTVMFMFNGDIYDLGVGLLGLAIAGIAFAVQGAMLYLWDRENKFSE